MARITLSDSTAIEAGIYAKLPLGEIVKKICKTTTAAFRFLLNIFVNKTAVYSKKVRGPGDSSEA